MVKYIQFGIFGKKLLLPFGVALVQIIINVMNIVLPEQPKNSILEMFISGVSEVSFAFLPYFIKYSSSSKNKFVIYRIKKRILHHSILLILFSIYVILNIFVNIQSAIYFQTKNSVQNPHNSGFSSLDSLELIFLCIVSILLLRYKYFIHHIISIIIIIIICFFIDFIIGNFPYILDRGAFFISLNIIVAIIDACDYAYQKYMMDVLFHPFWSLAVTIGVANIIMFGVIIIICLIKGKEEINKEQNLLLMSFYLYFDKVDVRIIITKHILNFVFTFFLNLFRVLTILHLTPDYILISFAISRIINIVIETKKYACLALFAIQFITLMFYLEIIELNFCGLSKNIRRNIHSRGQQELLSRCNTKDSSSSLIELTPDYLLSNESQDINNNNKNDNDNDENIIEMKEKL